MEEIQETGELRAGGWIANWNPWGKIMRIRFLVSRLPSLGETVNSYWAKATKIAEEVLK
jgi:hypothetical protein